MKKTIIDYSRRTPEKVLAIANAVSSMLFVNALFPAPPVVKTTFEDMAKTLSDSIAAAANADRQSLAKLRNDKKALALMMRKNADYVNIVVTDGNEEQLLSSGFEVSKTPDKNQLPTAIAKVAADFTNLAGKIDLSWNRSKHARYYRVFMSGDNGQTWTMLDSIFGRKMMVEQLNSGKRYQFKVVPVGLHGVGPESDVTSQLAA